MLGPVTDFIEAVEDPGVEELGAIAAIEARDESVLGRLAGRDMVYADAPLKGLSMELPPDGLGAVEVAQRACKTAPADAPRVFRARRPRQRCHSATPLSTHCPLDRCECSDIPAARSPKSPPWRSAQALSGSWRSEFPYDDALQYPMVPAQLAVHALDPVVLLLQLAKPFEIGTEPFNDPAQADAE